MKNIDLSISLSLVKKALYTFLHRFHAITFVIVVLGGLVLVILLLNDTIITSGESNDHTPQTTTTTFDQATMKRIEELKTRDQNTGIITQPGARTNPFVE